MTKVYSHAEVKAEFENEVTNILAEIRAELLDEPNILNVREYFTEGAEAGCSDAELGSLKSAVYETIIAHLEVIAQERAS